MADEVDYGYDAVGRGVDGPEEDLISIHSYTTMSAETHTQGDDEESQTVDLEIAQRETQAVDWLRGAVFTTLAVASVVVSTLVFTSLSHTQAADFHNAFEDASEKIFESFQEKVQHKLGAVDSFALDLSSFARGTDAVWPMVTVADFDVRGASMRSLADALEVMLLPVVTGDSKQEWEGYSVQHQDWIPQEDTADVEYDSVALARRRRQQQVSKGGSIPSHIYDENGPVEGEGPFAPLWQISPVLPGMTWMVNMDMLSIKSFAGGISAVLEGKGTVLGEVSNLHSSNESPTLQARLHEILTSEGPEKTPAAEPISPLFYPIYDHYESDSKIVAVLTTMFSWRYYFTDVLSPRTKGIVCVVENVCGQSFTYQIDGHDVTYVGEGDHHDSSFNLLGKSADLADDIKSSEHIRAGASPFDGDYCSYTLSVYPSKEMHEEFITHRPVTNTVVVAFIFAFALLLFAIYDFLVERRQKIVLEHALQSTAIVSSLFPDVVRDRLFRRESGDGPGNSPRTEPTSGLSRQNSLMSTSSLLEPTQNRLKTFLNDSDGSKQNGNADKPLADLFPNCTVLFADIAGFTAWSSLRDPSQVFTLLESVYQAFDKIARKRGVFKVETIGDSYVAVTGLPEPQEDHAIIMSRFARDCRTQFKEVTHKLELTLGPDTGDLAMRFGLHSGPVTAGVLRGEKSRFQLFGDTVNTAARMESTGERDRIQVSQQTADIIIEAGRGRWVKARDKMVEAKGKGCLQTYWVDTATSASSGDARSACSEDSHDGFPGGPGGKSNLWGKESEIPEVAIRNKHQRLVDYNVDLLCGHLRQLVARRMVIAAAGRRDSEGLGPPELEAHRDSNKRSMVLEEVTETIKLPKFDPRAFKDHVDPDSVVLEPAVISQLKRYVTIVGAMYRNNPFHNFEHASHVTMSMNKLLQRVVKPNIDLRGSVKDKSNMKEEIASELHNYTYGITSDPLTQFALVFSALIHDCDHWGVSNNQLIKEGVPIASKYQNKSVAEQNSVDLAWDLLMESDEYGDLQRCIFPTDDEYKRFRQVVVNIVMSTDIFDKELGGLRKNRWAKAFGNPNDVEGEEPEDPEYQQDLKATIVIEHIMQASDIAHTMQHWHVYQKWNRRLFDELYTAHRAGRMEVDPSTFWYKGELGFFDNYIIPLGEKLKQCGVFGVSSDECLNYATENRREWEAKGEMIVAELVESFQKRDKEDTGGPVSTGKKKKKQSRHTRRRSLLTTGG
jgi:class 3 adenylate cyclase